MTEPSSTSPAADDQDEPGLLDRIMGRSGDDDRGPAEEQVEAQEEQVVEEEEQGAEEQPTQATGGAESGRDHADDDGGSKGRGGSKDDGGSTDDGASKDDGGSKDPEEHDDLDTDEDGQPSVGAMPDADDVDTDEIEKEREERLDPDNRPDNVEIDNTDRTFDSEKGMFTDDEGFDEAEAKYDDDAV